MAAILLAAAPLYAAGRRAAESEPPGAMILCYHIVESPSDPLMEISHETFLQQIRYLTVTGYTVVPLRDIYEYSIGERTSLPNKAVAVTVDDGWRSAYTEIFPEMQKLHLPFTVFIYPKIIGQTSYALTWKQIREMAEAGVDVESHSYSHPFLTRRRHESWSNGEYATWLERELVESKKILEKETGHPVSFLAYPYGDYDHYLARAVARAGYLGALTCEYGSNVPGTNPFRLHRMAIDKHMDFAAFRHYLGAHPMQIASMKPTPGETVDSIDALTISAKLPNYRRLDPKSVGIALLSMPGTVPYSYDARNGEISLTVGDDLKGTLQRALVWATDAKSGRRVEASWTFQLPNSGPFADPSTCPAIDPGALPTLPTRTAAPVGGDAAATEVPFHHGSNR